MSVDRTHMSGERRRRSLDKVHCEYEWPWRTGEDWPNIIFTANGKYVAEAASRELADILCETANDLGLNAGLWKKT
jgi:hypothetical protein